jgi:hypothetical protein
MTGLRRSSRIKMSLCMMWVGSSGAGTYTKLPTRRQQALLAGKYSAGRLLKGSPMQTKLLVMLPGDRISSIPVTKLRFER